MKLEFEQNSVPENLFEELDFNSYLALFDLNIPLLPSVILRPLNRQSGMDHFAELQALLDKFKSVKDSNSSINSLIDLSKKLPFMDHLLPFFKAKNLDIFHLYLLGNFVSICEEIEKLESSIPGEIGDGDICQAIKNTLSQYTEADFSGITLSSQEQLIKSEISDVEELIKNKLTNYEKEIEKATKLKMIYPYPKEIPKDFKGIESIKACPMLKILEKPDMFFIDYILPEEIRSLLKKRRDDFFKIPASNG